MRFRIDRGEIPSVKMPFSCGDAHVVSDRDGAEREPEREAPVLLRSAQIGQRLTLELDDCFRASHASPFINPGLISRHELVRMKRSGCITGDRAVEP